MIRNNVHLLGNEPIKCTYVHLSSNAKKIRYFRFCHKVPMGNYIHKKQYTQYKTVNNIINYFILLRTGPVLFSFLKKIYKFRRKYEQSFFLRKIKFQRFFKNHGMEVSLRSCIHSFNSCHHYKLRQFIGNRVWLSPKSRKLWIFRNPEKNSMFLKKHPWGML